MRRAVFFMPLAALALAQTGMRDRYFTRYPFEEWAAKGDRAQIRWTVGISRARLTAHQRLSTRIEIALDAHEIEKRHGRGEIVSFLQVEDANGRRWRTHNSFSLSAIPPGATARNLNYVQELFVLPGDYKISLATCDSVTREYSFARRGLRVAPLRGDPMPAAWKDLQPIEAVQRFDAPDYWFQPYVRGRLKLPLQTRRPVHLDVVMNMTPSERVSGSVRVFRRNMSFLVPSLKLLSDLQPENGTLDIALLDLTKRKTWEQFDVHGLDWNRMRAPFADANPGVIDAQSLSVKAEMKQFFWDQLLDRLKKDRQPDCLRVLIVLSAPVFLDRQFRVEPAGIAPDPSRKVFYLKVRPAPAPGPLLDPFNQSALPPSPALPNDDIEHTLKPLDAKVYNAIGPEEFRKAVSSLMAEVERM